MLRNALRQWNTAEKWSLILLAVTLIKGMTNLLRLAWIYLAYQPINWDTMVYLSIGRGILNGLKPYTGLYEMKPPGIFLISALSLAVTDNEVFGLILQWVTHLLLPLLCGWTAWKLARNEEKQERALIVLTALAFGLIISLYAEYRGMAFQSEGFGFFFALLYVLAIAQRGRMTALSTIIAVIGIVGSVGMKEPFLLSAAASALVLRDADKPFWRTFGVPAAAAVVMGFILLVVLGYTDGYLTVHLPFIFSSRLAEGVPLPVRGMAIGHVLMDTAIPPLPLFSLFIGFLFYRFLRGPDRSARDDRRLLASFAASVILSTLLWFTLEGAELVTRLEWTNVNIIRHSVRGALGITQEWTMWKWTVVVLLILGFMGTLRASPRGSRPVLLRLLGALYLVTLAVALGGFFGSHMLFALPLYCALFFHFLAHLPANRQASGALFPCGLLLLGTVLFSFQADHERILRSEEQYNARVNAILAEHFDDIMRDCTIKRYFIVGDAALLSAHTHYSPIGPLVFQLPFMADDHPMLMDYYQRGLDTAQLAVVTAGARNRDLMLYLLQESGFTAAVPPCAQPYPEPLGRYMLYFRLPAVTP